MGVLIAIFLWGALLVVNGSPVGGPVLDQSGFQNLVIAISDDVPEEIGSELIQSIEELMTETSEMMYYASNTRFYVKDVTILAPKTWSKDKVPQIGGVARRGEVYEHAAIQVGPRNRKNGDMPYTHQPNGCGQEGNPVFISDQYLLDLVHNRDEMIVHYGPIGKFLTQEFTKYRYGIYEEYGFPGKNALVLGEKYPSMNTRAYLSKDGTWKTAVVNNTCADSRLEGKLLHIDGEGEDFTIVEGCDFDNDGSIATDTCFFAADNVNNAFASMGSYQYTDLVSVFCDDEYFPHNHDSENRHNHECLDETRGYEPMSTYETILKHTDFEFGHNEGGYVSTTVPTFSVYSASTAKFVLVLDNSGSMGGCSRMENLKTTIKRWVDALAPSTKVALVKFGDNSHCATGSKTFTKDCYVEISTENNGEAEKLLLRMAVDEMSSNMGGTNMGQAMLNAHMIMKDEHDESQGGSPGVLMLVTDGMDNGEPAIDDMKVWNKFHMSSIRVLTLNIGHEIDSRMQTLVSETGGKAFVSKDCSGSGSGDVFQYASETWIPNDVGDKAMKNVVTKKEMVLGVHMRDCKQNNDGKECFKTDLTIEKSLNKEVNINMRMNQQGQLVADARTFIGDVSVKKKLTNETLKIKREVDGFSLSFDNEYKNFADFRHVDPVPEEFTEELLEVYLTPLMSNPPTPEENQNFTRTTIEFTVTAKRNFVGEEDADYTVNCKHPPVMTTGEPFKIVSQVKRGDTPVDHANVVARVHIARESDPNAGEDPMFFELRDDGLEQVSGDMMANDGTYTAQLSPASLHIRDGTGISVMCNLVASPDGQWNDNDFYGRKRGVPTQSGMFSPYCCGTKDQPWNIPKSKDVVNLLRSSIESGAFLDPSLFVKGADFGPPARVADLAAEKVGEDLDGLVKLTWTATGDDWGSGTASSYNVVYSDKRQGLMSSNKVDPRRLVAGSMEPLPAGQQMELLVRIDDLHVPGTYMFALNATDKAGKVSRPSNVARVNFHDGSPLVMDADPHMVHGHKKNELPFEEKIRARVKDERIVKGFMELIEKNKKIVWNAENNVMEKRMVEKMGLKTSAVEKIMENIKKDEVLRAIYKSKLL